MTIAGMFGCPAIAWCGLVSGLASGLVLSCQSVDTVAIVYDNQERSAYCAASGPPELSDLSAEMPLCSRDVAARAFSRALCICEDLSTADKLATDSFDGSEQPYRLGGPHGSVGCNGPLRSHSTLEVLGSLIVAGENGIQTGVSFTVNGDVSALGIEGNDSTVSIGGNAEVAGNIRVADLTIAGTLTLPQEASLTIASEPSIGAVTRAPVAVEPPCACDESTRLDIRGFIDLHRDSNHNQAIGLDSELLVDFRDDMNIELPCGLYFLRRLQTESADLTIVVTGRTTLLIDEVNLGRSLRVEVLPGAELDLMIANHINVAGDIELRAQDRPAQIRVYVGGAGALNLSAQSVVYGNIYAPQTTISLTAETEIFGSVTAGHVHTAGPLTVHYDTSMETLLGECLR